MPSFYQSADKPRGGLCTLRDFVQQLLHISNSNRGRTSACCLQLQAMFVAERGAMGADVDRNRVYEL